MALLRFIALRLLQTMPVLFGVSIITFALMQLTPGDPVRLLAGPRASEAAIAAIRDRYGLDDPILSQYLTYLRNLSQGELGASLRYRMPVSGLISNHYPVTLALVALSVTLSAPMVMLLAVWSAKRQGGLADQVIRMVGVAGIALPVFWLALILSRFFGITLGWFPVSGFGETPLEHLHHLFLPALSTAIWVVPILVRNLRATLLDQMERDFVTAGLSKGLSADEVFRRHVFPNSALPTLNLFGIIVAGLLGGSIIVETVYAVPGMGRLMVESILSRDYFVVQGATLMFALTTITVMLLVDVAAALIDPRIAP